MPSVQRCQENAIDVMRPLVARIRPRGRPASTTVSFTIS
jgi:hypothetical protein